MTMTWPVADPETSRRALEKNAKTRARPKTTIQEDTALWRASTRLALATNRPGLFDRILEGLERSEAPDLGCVGERDRDAIDVSCQACEDGREFGE